MRLGRVHIPVFGAFAAVGLVAALWLSQKTAKRVGLDADKVWDAGFAAAVAAFVASRVLLIVMDPRSFLHYPLLVMSLPSLTYGGMMMTGLLVWLWLRWKKLPFRDVLDAWAPCACVLAAVLQWGHWVEGTDAGMPTKMPWGHVTPGDSMLGPVQPVQLFSITVALALGALLWWRLPQRKFAGEVAAWALALGGLAAFLLDFIRQPDALHGALPLDAGQMVAVAATMAGAWLWVQGLPHPLRDNAAQRMGHPNRLDGHAPSSQEAR
jgi:phosphatidylglycerol:prolipoprotein diacylglycerol transferase